MRRLIASGSKTELLTPQISRAAYCVGCICFLSRVPKHRDEVTRGARDNKQVPHEVAVADPLINRKKRHTHCVRDTACQ